MSRLIFDFKQLIEVLFFNSFFEKSICKSVILNFIDSLIIYLKQKNCDAVIIYVSALGGIESVSQLRSPGGHLPDAVFSKKDGRETYAEVLTSIFVGESEPSARSDSEESAASVQAV